MKKVKDITTKKNEKLLNIGRITIIKSEGGINMEWLYGLGALFFGGGSLLFYVQQLFIISLISLSIAILLVYLLEL